LLETLSLDAENKKSFLFYEPVDTLVFNSGDSPKGFFKRIDNYLTKGLWVAGYFTYEFGYFLEKSLSDFCHKGRSPLVWLGVFKAPEIFSKKGPLLKREFLQDRAQTFYEVRNVKPDIGPREYSAKIAQIKEYLCQGLTYQVNLTFKVNFDFYGYAAGLYSDLKKNQPTVYTAFIDTGPRQVLSFSPELFFRQDKKTLLARPMKGTIKRGLNYSKDKKCMENLLESEKDRAENIMIVDLLRNDLGRVSAKVRVPNLFQIERHKTLYQMTSTISARLKNKIATQELFTSLFPCGSVTGAPKIQTMKIIKELENKPRGVYTGAIGYMSPDNKACFNVAIRTLEIHKGRGSLGVGAGIVYDSVSSREYEETLLKARFFTDNNQHFHLIESLLLDEGRYWFLDEHLRRLAKSCRYFGIQYDSGKLKRKLQTQIKSGRYKVRILVSRRGHTKIKVVPLAKAKPSVKVQVSSQTTNPENIFLYHKTTRRRLYNEQRKNAISEGFDEALFINAKGEFTEGTISNIFISSGKLLYTPPISCGLLPGVLRQHLLSSGRAREKTLRYKEVFGADKVYLGNSVQGLRKVSKITFKDKELRKKLRKAQPLVK